jgi:hypothetical protein
MDVAFIRKDQRRRNGMDRRARLFVVMADGGRDDCDIVVVHAEFLQDLPRHQRAAVRVIGSVDGISDVVHVAGDLRKFDRLFVIAQLPQNHPRVVCGFSRVRLRMVRVSQRAEHGIAGCDICIDFLIVPDVDKP